MNKTIIELNGKHYDARTGKLLSATDIIPPSRQHVVVHEQHRAQPHSDASRHTEVHKANSATLQRSVTLNRNAVNKPAAFSQVVVHKNTVHPSLSTPPLSRLARAESIKPSSFIQKFHHKGSHVIEPKLAHMPVAPVPVNHDTPKAAHHAASPIEHFMDNHLSNARSHEEAAHSHKRSFRHKVARTFGVTPLHASVVMSIFAVLLLTGFFAFQNIPNFAIRVAAKRAGFAASLPGYRPAGFSFKGPISYNSNQIVVSYKANSDPSRNYTVTQKASSWDSDTLLTNVVAANSRPFQTYRDKGLTLYLYDNSNATWVNNGIWYTVEGPSNLSTDQLLKVATSM